MTIALPEFKPEEREHLVWSRAVRGAFARLEGTETVFRYLHSRAPYTLGMTLARVPVEVRVVSAMNRTDRRIESSVRVTWEWTGALLKIHALDVSDTNDEYDVRIVVRE